MLQINGKMSGHMASEGDINAMVKEVSFTRYWMSPNGGCKERSHVPFQRFLSVDMIALYCE